MNDLEESESWHEDLMAWERFQDELERISGEILYEELQDFQNRNYPCNRKSPHNLTQNNSLCNEAMLQPP